jgi:hypothetical protein
MSLSPLRKLLQGLAAIIGVLSALLGIILLLSGFGEYISAGDPDIQPFEQILLAVGFLGIPASGFLFFRTHRNLKRGVNPYGLPDAPTRSLFLVLLTVALIALTATSFVIVLTVF